MSVQVAADMLEASTAAVRGWFDNKRLAGYVDLTGWRWVELRSIEALIAERSGRQPIGSDTAPPLAWQGLEMAERIELNMLRTHKAFMFDARGFLQFFTGDWPRNRSEMNLWSIPRDPATFLTTMTQRLDTVCALAERLYQFDPTRREEWSRIIRIMRDDLFAVSNYLEDHGSS